MCHFLSNVPCLEQCDIFGGMWHVWRNVLFLEECVIFGGMCHFWIRLQKIVNPHYALLQQWVQLVLRGHKTKREADYGSKKIGYSLSQKKREKKGSKAQERPKSLSPRLCVGQLCTPRLAKRHNMFGQFMKEHSEVRTIWFPFRCIWRMTSYQKFCPSTNDQCQHRLTMFTAAQYCYWSKVFHQDFVLDNSARQA